MIECSIRIEGRSRTDCVARGTIVVLAVPRADDWLYVTLGDTTYSCFVTVVQHICSDYADEKAPTIKVYARLR